MLEKLWNGIYKILGWFLDALIYVAKKLFELILDAIAAVIEALPKPAFLEGQSLSSLIPADMHYFIAAVNLDACLIIIGAGYLFYFLRRVLTLGIW